MRAKTFVPAAGGILLVCGTVALVPGCSPQASTQAATGARPAAVPQQVPVAPARPAKVEEEEEGRPRTARPVPKVDDDTRPGPARGTAREEEEDRARPARPAPKVDEEGKGSKPPRKEEEEEPRPARKPGAGPD